MRRRVVHMSFGGVALLCAVLTVYHAGRLHQARQVNAAIGNATASNLTSTVPEARLARASELAKKGSSDAAIKIYKELSRGDREDLRAAAFYNLGNLYMRLALRSGENEQFAALPLIELAKQSYRNVLRSDPENWNARYNLERALWLAPELEEAVVEEGARSNVEERVMSTLQGTRSDLP